MLLFNGMGWNGMRVFALVLFSGEWIMFRESLDVSFVFISIFLMDFITNQGSSSIQHNGEDSYDEVQDRFHETGTLSSDSDRFAMASFGK